MTQEFPDPGLRLFVDMGASDNIMNGIATQTTKAPPPPPKPCILGIVTADMLARRKYPSLLWACGGVELRADGLSPDEIAAAVADFDEEKGRRGFTGPVIFTLRLQRDGGAWANEDAPARNEVWTSLPPGTCDWVDLEIEQIDSVDTEALDSLRSSGVKILLSHHAFSAEETSAWDGLLSVMRRFKPDGVKFAVTPTSSQLPDLVNLARRVAAEFPASCVLGMGPEASVTRVLSPLLGCPFTYGFLGEGAVAPGQLSAKVMAAFFERAATDAQRPDEAASASEWIGWTQDLLKQVTGV